MTKPDWVPNVVDRAEDPIARQALPSVWSVLLPYWRSEERWRSGVVLCLSITIGFGSVYIAVWNNQWTGKLYDAIGSKHYATLPHLLLVFLLVSLGHTALTMITYVADAWVELRWRVWLTRHLIDRWMGKQVYYRIERDGNMDNVDQRIADDVRLFVGDTLRLALNTIRVPVSAVTFTVVLWRLTGSVDVLVAGHLIPIPGYMAFAAYLYMGSTLWLTHLIGKRLISVNARQQRLEGDFRVMMVQIREYAEQIAFYRGSGVEITRLRSAFEAVRDNAWDLIKIGRNVMVSTSLYGQLGTILPTVLMLPKLMSGQVSLGGLMQAGSAFAQVTGALSFFPQSYQNFTTWRAEANRLRELYAITERREGSDIVIERAAAQDAELAVSFDRVILKNSDEAILSIIPDTTIIIGERWLITGPSGAGKSTLLRAIAGLWPYGGGKIRRSSHTAMFVPQRSYLPTGTLKDTICYPAEAERFTDDACVEVLTDCGLLNLIGHLYETDRWSMRLSGGEQQRLAFARVLLHAPQLLFLDEATSALDPDAEAALYQLIVSRLSAATMVSVAHREALKQFHTKTLEITHKELYVDESLDRASRVGASLRLA